MAIENQSKPKEPLNKALSMAAGMLSAAAAMGGIAGSTIYMARVSMGAEITAAVIADMVLLGVVFIAGVQLMLGREAAQRMLLIIFMAVAIVATTFCLSAMLTSVPEWWDDFTPVPFMAIMIPLAAGSVLLSVLLVLASNSGTRMRYASLTGCSVAVAVALIIAVNMIAQAEGKYKRYDIEQLSFHRLSERTEKILADVKSPLKITCIYAPSNKKDRELTESKYRPRLMNMLKDMQELNSNIEIVDASSDVEKAEVATMLKGVLRKQAVEHSRFVDDFMGRSGAVIEGFRNQRSQWTALKDNDCYLSNWTLPVYLEMTFDKFTKDWEGTRSVINRKLESTGGMVDYAELVEEISDLLKVTGPHIHGFSDMLRQIAEVPGAVEANRAAVQKALDEAVASIKAMSEAVGSPDDPPPASASEVLKKFAAAAENAAEKLQAAGNALDRIDGENGNGYALRSDLMKVPIEGEEVPPSLGEFLKSLRGVPDMLAAQAKSYIEKATPEAQLELVNAKRKDLKELLKIFEQVGEKASDAIKQLASVDEPTKKIFAEAREGTLFKPFIDTIDELSAEAEKLPELKTTFTPNDISGDNIVVIEFGDKVEVVSFDEIWPLRSMTGFDDENNRYFDGDAAISSRILNMTRTLPFAVVFMASLEPEIPPEMAPYVSPPEISSENMKTVVRSLEKANLKVVHWNLTSDMPEVDEKYKDLPRVLLVLPPTQVMTQFGPRLDLSFSKEHAGKIIAAIDSGISAVVLTWCNPRNLSSGGDSLELWAYLHDKWGIDEKTDYMVFPAQPDKTEPGKYLFDKNLFGYFPLSTFTDHPIGKPLQGDRMLWFGLCPVVAAEKIPSGVTVEDVLVVHRGRTGVWATKRLKELVEQISARGSLVQPDYAAGDMAPPFAVAVAAVREGSKDSGPTRMVVMGNACALIDEYLTANVDVGEAGMKLDDPPRNNPDIVVNSVYWASGNGNRIAAGPEIVKPIAMLSKGTETLIRVLVVAGLPLLLLAMGGLVMYIRCR